MKTYKQFLLEHTFRIGKDVDFIYNKTYKKFVNAVIKYNKTGGVFPKLPNKIEISSSELKSKDAKNAHKMNPIKIIAFNDPDEGNAYSPVYKSIFLNPNQEVIDLIKREGGIEQASNVLYRNQEAAFKDELTEKRIKATIYHELSHWIDDSLHNFHITTMINQVRSNPKNAQKILKQDGADSLDSFYEINAQIHALKQYKRSMNKKLWDRLAFSDVERMFASMNNVSSTLKSRYGVKEYQRWKKEILKRMAREKLLGKNMKNK
jgi:hypothetical protein